MSSPACWRCVVDRSRKVKSSYHRGAQWRTEEQKIEQLLSFSVRLSYWSSVRLCDKLFHNQQLRPTVRLQTLLACATLVAAQSDGAQAPITVIVEGATHTVSAGSLQKLARDTARMVFHDQPVVVYQGVSLAAVLREAGVRTDSLRGPALATRLVVEASDGYRIVLTLADLAPSLSGQRVLLADRMDGKALPASEAPWRLIVVGDQRPSRSARQVVRILVLAEPR